MMGKCLVQRRLESIVVRGREDSPKTFHKNVCAPKSYPLRNKLGTTPDPPIFSHPTNDFQKPMKFVSSKESKVGEKKGEKPSEGKPNE
jgi:hypothetical protein